MTFMRFVRFAFVLTFLTVCATLAAAENISGPISVTKIIANPTTCQPEF
jgi:hypothetical protein